jgi:adenine-specific DNA-methyltransferase
VGALQQESQGVTPAANERELAERAVLLIGSVRGLTVAERNLLPRNGRKVAAQGDDLRQAIRAGLDPLGVDFIRLRSPETRRGRGAIYTPSAIVDAMIDWALSEGGDPPARIVDPGSGSGRFLIAAAAAFPDAALCAIEIDPLAALILRANAAAAGFAHRLTVHVGDYRTIDLPRLERRTLFIGNPPYVRHHQIDEDAKHWFATTAGRFGFKASKLAGLHIHFFMRTREIAQANDFGAFITSSEWLDVNYGSALRAMLADGLGGTALHILDPTTRPFGDAMTTAAIACFRVGCRPETFAIRAVRSLDELKPLAKGKTLSWSTVAKARRWSTLIAPAARKPAGVIELGELFRVHRGQVTGCNAVWIETADTPNLPARFLFPAITRARELFALNGQSLDDTHHLRRVVDLTANLDELTAAERRAVDKFLAWARKLEAHKGFIATHRRPWWCVGLRDPPPILCTYMARRPPVFIRNKARAHYLNIAHGLYPRQSMTDTQLAGVLRYLRETVNMAGGRTYAGGLVKYEPGEVERLHILPPDTIVFHVSA